jgi:hypothetical protein
MYNSTINCLQQPGQGDRELNIIAISAPKLQIVAVTVVQDDSAMLARDAASPLEIASVDICHLF